MKRRILIVEDDDIFLRPLPRSLEVAGYEVVTRPSGEDALDLLKNDDVDAVLTDKRLPGMDGVERKLKLPDSADRVARSQLFIADRGVRADEQLGGETFKLSTRFGLDEGFQSFDALGGRQLKNRVKLGPLGRVASYADGFCGRLIRLRLFREAQAETQIDARTNAAAAP